MAILTAFLVSVSPGGRRRMELWVVSVNATVSPLSLFMLTWLVDALTSVTVPVRMTRAGAAVCAEAPESITAATIKMTKAYFMGCQPNDGILNSRGVPSL